MKLISVICVPQVQKPTVPPQQLQAKYVSLLQSAYHDESRKQVVALVVQKQQLAIAATVVIGIGGSNMATMAVQQFLDADAPLYYVDSLDTDYTERVYMQLKQLLQAGKHILLNVISKSGTTTETIANFQLLYTLVQEFEGDRAHLYIVVTTDKDTPLWRQASTHNWSMLEIPHEVGGRFSAFTPAALFPLAMANFAVDEYLAGAQQMYTTLITDTENDAAITAQWLYHYLQQGYDIQNLFLFGNQMYALGKWWQQLMGETLGKAVHIDGSAVTHTMVPMVSVGTADLHAVGQLFLAARAHIATTFVTVERNQHTIKLAESALFNSLVPHLQKQPYAYIMRATAQGVMAAYREKSLPYIDLVVREKTMFAMGQFLQFYMHQVLYLAQLLEVNPLDQPEVELYKRQVRKNLADA